MKEHLQDFSYPKILETPQVFKAKLLLNPFPNDRFLDTSTMKEFANDNFKFDENSRGFYKLVENTEGKGEISPLLTVISKDLFCRHPGLVWERLNPLLHRYSFWRINNRQLLKTLWEKEKIACNEQFLLFPQYFLLNQITVTVSPFVHISDIISLLAAESEDPKIGIWGKGLISDLMKMAESSLNW